MPSEHRKKIAHRTNPVLHPCPNLMNVNTSHSEHILLALTLAFMAIGLGACPSSPTLPTEETTQAQPDPPQSTTPTAQNTSSSSSLQPTPGSRPVQDAGPPAPTLFILSGLKGYLEPCGCTLDVQVGGIDRIAGYLAQARKAAQGSLVVDAGNMLFELPELESHRIEQDKLKATYVLKAHQAFGTISTTPGPNDFALGKHYYLDHIREAGLEILAANLKEEGGIPMGLPHMVHDLQGTRVGVIGLVDPSLFVGLEGLEVSDPIEAAKRSVAELRKEKVHAIVAVFHANLATTKTLLEAVPEIHFAVVGSEPRETDQVDQVGDGFTLEALDQGRYLGILKLYPRDQTPPQTFVNARAGSKAELERIDRRIAQIEGQIKRLPPATPGNEPPMLKTLRQQLNTLKAKKQTTSVQAITMPASDPAFIYRAVPLEPGYPLSETLTQALASYETERKAIAKPQPPLPPQAGVEYVGTQQCASCHPKPMAVWKETAHSRAIKTLKQEDKVTDQDCVGCHVVGYRKPGGSNLGNLIYPAAIGEGDARRAFTKNLEHVGCEVCHGPGSQHLLAPVNAQGKPQHIQLQAPESLCVDCHNSQHSPKFNYPVYIEQVLGEGHARRP
ncbi:MAG: multiheme c-type cytochrome [Myxococcota bacterium]